MRVVAARESSLPLPPLRAKNLEVQQHMYTNVVGKPCPFKGGSFTPAFKVPPGTQTQKYNQLVVNSLSTHWPTHWSGAYWNW
jgi:hypothetical protein